MLIPSTFHAPGSDRPSGGRFQIQTKNELEQKGRSETLVATVRFSRTRFALHRNRRLGEGPHKCHLQDRAGTLPSRMTTPLCNSFLQRPHFHQWLQESSAPSPDSVLP